MRLALRITLLTLLIVVIAVWSGCSGRPKKAAPATEAEKAAMERPTVMGPTGPGGAPPKDLKLAPK